MENKNENIFDFAEFKRRKEEEDNIKEAKDKRLEDSVFSGGYNVPGEGLYRETLRLVFSFNGRIISKVRPFVKPNSTAYREAYSRADQLSLEEIRGQIESANESLIKSHPTWYVVLLDNLRNRTRAK